MDNLTIKMEDFKNIKKYIKEKFILDVNFINNITSKDKNFEYLTEENVSIEEDSLVKEKKKEDNKYYRHNRINFRLCFLLFSTLFFIFFNLITNIEMIKSHIILCIIYSLIGGFFITFITCLNSNEDLEKKACPRKLRDLYKKFFIDNIDDYLPLNGAELKQLYNSNKFIKAYVDNNPNEIFTRYSLNTVAGIKMNNLHMINEFKDIIDNKKMLLGLPEGQKIVVHNLIKNEQKL